MANDRIFITCRGCKAKAMLAKYYPTNMGVWNRDKLCDFIDNHINCTADFKGDLEGDRCFDLSTESDKK